MDITKQEILTKAISGAIKECEIKYPVECNNHKHLCTFQMMGLSRHQAKKECRCWREKHPIKFPDKWPEPFYTEDYCDFCDMMNYVLLDDYGRIIYVTRTHPDQLRFYFNHKSEI